MESALSEAVGYEVAEAAHIPPERANGSTNRLWVATWLPLTFWMVEVEECAAEAGEHTPYR